MSISDTISRALADKSGAAGVEFALMAPALTLFLIGIVDVGSLAYQKSEVSAAAVAGAQYAIRNGGDLTNIASAVTSATPLTVSATPAPQQIYACVSDGALTVVAGANSTCAGGGTPGTYIQVSAQATYKPIVNWDTLSMPGTLSATSMVRIQ